MIDWNVVWSAAIGSGFVGFLFKLLEKLTDYLLLKQNKKKDDLSVVLEKALKIISESEVSKCRYYPREIEHVKYIQNLLSQKTPKLGNLFQDYCDNLWLPIVRLNVEYTNLYPGDDSPKNKKVLLLEKKIRKLQKKAVVMSETIKKELKK